MAQENDCEDLKKNEINETQDKYLSEAIGGYLVHILKDLANASNEVDKKNNDHGFLDVLRLFLDHMPHDNCENFGKAVDEAYQFKANCSHTGKGVNIVTATRNKIKGLNNICCGRISNEHDLFIMFKKLGICSEQILKKEIGKRACACVRDYKKKLDAVRDNFSQIE